MRLAMATCTGWPEWLAQASAICSGSRAAPASWLTVACSGLIADRWKKGRSRSPQASITSPSEVTAAANHSWVDSTRPERTVAASTLSR